jgi:formylglycine-generating enzyme required for sulfatase activity
VENVNWYQAIAFCNKLSLLDGKEPVYSVKESGTEINWESLTYAQIPTSSNAEWNAATMDTNKNGYRLPTEMEWMWAAMGADKTAQPNRSGYSKTYAGSIESGTTTNIGNYAWYTTNSGEKTHEVGKKSANELGLRDMTGNVWEWCWDRYGGTAGNSGTVAETGKLTDFTGAASGSFRVVRGGCWDAGASNCAVADRSYFGPSVQVQRSGVPVCLPLSSATGSAGTPEGGALRRFGPAIIPV